MAKRQVAMGCARGGDNTATWIAYSDAINPDTGKWSGKIALRDDQLGKPLHWKEPRRIFVCSMSDLFHPKIPFEFIDKIHAAMIVAVRHSHYHTYLILTKRIKRMLKYYSSNRRPQLYKILEKDYDMITGFFGINWPFPNIHLGVSISNPDEMWKAEVLSRIPAAVRWISFEPLLADVGEIPLISCREDDNNLEEFGQHIDWVVVGGESGPGARYCPIENIRGIVEQCKAANIPVFVKQIHLWQIQGSGGWLFETEKEALESDIRSHLEFNNKIAGKKNKLTPKRVLIKDIKQFPKDLRIQQYPERI